MEHVPESTCDDVGRVARGPWGAALRTGGAVLLLLVILAGVVGLLGVRSAVAEASGGGYDLRLEYPRIARGGLDVPWSLTVERPGGFDGRIVLAMDASYFDVLEMRGRLPEPASETVGDGRVLFTFEPPPGDEFVFSLDVRIRAGEQWGESGFVSLVEDGTDVVTIEFDTWVVP